MLCDLARERIPKDTDVDLDQITSLDEISLSVLNNFCMVAVPNNCINNTSNHLGGLPKHISKGSYPRTSIQRPRFGCSNQ